MTEGASNPVGTPDDAPAAVTWQGWVEDKPTPVCLTCGELWQLHDFNKKGAPGKDGHPFAEGGLMWRAHASVVLPRGQRPRSPWHA